MGGARKGSVVCGVCELGICVMRSGGGVAPRRNASWKRKVGGPGCFSNQCSMRSVVGMRSGNVSDWWSLKWELTYRSCSALKSGSYLPFAGGGTGSAHIGRGPHEQLSKARCMSSTVTLLGLLSVAEAMVLLVVGCRQGRSVGGLGLLPGGGSLPQALGAPGIAED